LGLPAMACDGGAGTARTTEFVLTATQKIELAKLQSTVVTSDMQTPTRAQISATDTPVTSEMLHNQGDEFTPFGADFEDGIGDWRVTETDKTEVFEIIVKETPGPNDGSSLMLMTEFGGQTWQSVTVGVQIPEAKSNWSDYVEISFDFFMEDVPGYKDVRVQPYIKVGPEFTYYYAETMIEPNGIWITVRMPLSDLVSDLGELNSVREFGIKVGTSATTYAGPIYFDNIKLLLQCPIVWSFEGSSDKWSAAEYSEATSVTAVKEHATDGEYSLQADFNIREDKAIYQIEFPNAPLDLSTCSTLVVDITTRMSGLQLALAVSSGEEWEWHESKPLPLDDGLNLDLEFDLNAMDFKAARNDFEDFTLPIINREEGRRIALLIFSDIKPRTAAVYFDNVRILP